MFYKSFYYALLMVIFGFLGYIFLNTGFNTKTRVKIEYEDKSDVYYKVNYVDNSYNLDKDRYVSNMVDNIDITYNYNNQISEYVTGYYKYDVNASLITYEKDITDSLWERNYELVKQETVVIDDKNINSIKIADSFKVDFKKYREEIYKFIDTFDIDVSGYLSIKINIVEFLNFESLNNVYEDNKVITINIPLTNELFKINIQNVDSKNSCYEFTSDDTMNLVLLIIGVFCGSVSLSLGILVIRQFKIIYNKQSKYKKKLKKILSRYDDCIVKVKRFYVSKKYNMIYVDSFDELIDIYNSKNKMISFKEVRKDCESIFVIIDEDDAWIYKLIASNEK